MVTAELGGGGGVPSTVVTAVGGFAAGGAALSEAPAVGIAGAEVVWGAWAVLAAGFTGPVGAAASGRISAALRISLWMTLDDTPRSFR